MSHKDFGALYTLVFATAIKVADPTMPWWICCVVGLVALVMHGLLVS